MKTKTETKKKNATPGARTKGGKFYANVRFGKGRRLEIRVPWAKDLEATSERAELIAAAAKKLAGVGRRDLVKGFAKQLAEAATEQRLARVQKAVDVVLKGAHVGTSHDITFEQWAEKMTSGDLAREYPDRVKMRSYKNDVSRLKEYILRLVKDVPVVDFQFAHAQLVMSKLPPMSEANRRQVGQIIGRLMHLAVNPGMLIKASPLPRGWLPKVTKRRHYSCLYPLEEQQLLEDQEQPEVWRLFCGVLDREGMRLSMLLDCDWSQWGWAGIGGTFTQTRTKTGDPHLVTVRTDTAVAMALWLEKQKAAGKAHEKPFAGVLELVSDRTKIAEYFRASLRKAGIAREELFTSTEFTGKLRAHDMRATFVTISLAEGKSETFIRDRTSHKSTAMIDRYRRLARQVADLELGSLCDLPTALGWWKAGGSDVADPPTEDEPTTGKCTGGDLNPYVFRRWNLNPVGGLNNAPAELISRWKAGLRGEAKPASTSLPPPQSRSFTPPTADQSSAGETEQIARAPGAHSPGPSKAMPRAAGPVTASEARLVGAQRGAAALALDWDVLDRAAAALGDNGDDNGRGDA